MVCVCRQYKARSDWLIATELLGIIYYLLVYLNGNNAAEGENNIKYANSYPMN